MPCSPARELAAALDELGEYLQRQLAQVEVQRARLEALLDSIAAGILVTDRDGRSERLEVQREPCRLRQLAESCASAVGKLASDKRIAIAVEIPDELSAWCDRKLIEQALINLLDNAVKYTSEGGGVRVRARVSEQEAEQRNGASRMEVALPGPPDPRNRIAVEVTDTGIGIPSAELGRVFERFYRVDKGRSRALGGTGLGLAIVRHVIEAHNERLWVESELGKGSTFGFTLPAVS